MTAVRADSIFGRGGIMDAQPEPGGPDPALDPRSRRDRGISVYAALFDVPEQDVLDEFSVRVGAAFAEEQLQAAGGMGSSHPQLSDRDRDIAVITALVAQGVTGDRLETHVRLAAEHGIGEDALTALMTLLATYLGYPRASLAMETVHGCVSSGNAPTP